MNKFLFFLLIVTSSCKKDTVEPTGSFKITYQSNPSVSGGGPYYLLYTEASYLRNDPLQQGTMAAVGAGTGVYEVTLTDLNSGNYVISAYVGTSRSTRVVQVTAGRERDYTF